MRRQVLSSGIIYADILGSLVSTPQVRNNVYSAETHIQNVFVPGFQRDRNQQLNSESNVDFDLEGNNQEHDGQVDPNDANCLMLPPMLPKEAPGR